MTPQSRHNVWWVGDERPSLWIFSEQYFEDSLTEEVTGAGKDIFEKGFKFVASEARYKFDIIDPADRGVNGEPSGSDQGVIMEQAITGNL